MLTSRDSNPHLLQVSSPSQSIRLLEASRLQRELDDNAPRSTYRRRRGELKTLSHWGQKKLLLSEIEFLASFVSVQTCTTQPYSCLYAGASPGEHIPYLCYLFPQVHFILVDPRPFCVRLRDPALRPANVTLRQELLTREVIAEVHSGNLTTLLFISDIRSADWQELSSHSAMDNEVASDMQLQQEWHEALRPRASMLKFRLPWSAGVTKYLKGKIFFPVCGPVGTSEARLVVEGPTDAQLISDTVVHDYDHQKYWEQMFHFNTISRPAAYLNPASEFTDELDQCYDCTAEAMILQSYIFKYSPTWEQDTDTKSASGSGVRVNDDLEELQHDEWVTREVAAMAADINLFLWTAAAEAMQAEHEGPPRKRAKQRAAGDWAGGSRVSCHLAAPSTPRVLLDSFCRAQANLTSQYKELQQATTEENSRDAVLTLAWTGWVPWLAVEEPELLELPSCALLDEGAYGVGLCVPAASGLDVWLWQVLREVAAAVVSGAQDAALSGSIGCPAAAVVKGEALERDLNLSLLHTDAVVKREVLDTLFRAVGLGACTGLEGAASLRSGSVRRAPIALLLPLSSGCAYMLGTDSSAVRGDWCGGGSCLATRLNVPMQRAAPDVALVLCCGEVVLSPSGGGTGSIADVCIEVSSVHACKVSVASCPEEAMAVDVRRQDVAGFLASQLDFSSEEWRQDVLAASGLSSISASTRISESDDDGALLGNKRI